MTASQQTSGVVLAVLLVYPRNPRLVWKPRLGGTLPSLRRLEGLPSYSCVQYRVCIPYEVRPLPRLSDTQHPSVWVKLKDPGLLAWSRSPQNVRQSLADLGKTQQISSKGSAIYN